MSSARLTTSSTRTLARTIYLTGAQPRSAKLPLSIRIGTRCGAFGLPVSPFPTPAPTPIPTPEPGTFGAGAFSVGTGVAPGTYTAVGASCWWAGLSGFGGTAFGIRGPSFTPYGNPLANGQSPVFSFVEFVGTSTGYLTFDVVASDFSRLELTINDSAVVHLY